MRDAAKGGTKSLSETPDSARVTFPKPTTCVMTNPRPSSQRVSRSSRQYERMTRNLEPLGWSFEKYCCEFDAFCPVGEQAVECHRDLVMAAVSRGRSARAGCYGRCALLTTACTSAAYLRRTPATLPTATARPTSWCSSTAAPSSSGRCASVRRAVVCDVDLVSGEQAVDTLTRAERSARMSRIRGVHTKPELLVRSFLHRAGLRFRLHSKGLAGRPDIVLTKHGVVVFVDGCFWHGHTCQKGRIPGTNSAFWALKIDANRRRDRRNSQALRREGWRVFRVWECQLTKVGERAKVLSRLVARIVGSS
jgi:DNA mismatch endonuclease (patch repair protein)